MITLIFCAHQCFSWCLIHTTVQICWKRVLNMFTFLFFPVILFIFRIQCSKQTNKQKKKSYTCSMGNQIYECFDAYFFFLLFFLFFFFFSISLFVTNIVITSLLCRSHCNRNSKYLSVKWVSNALCLCFCKCF